MITAQQLAAALRAAANALDDNVPVPGTAASYAQPAADPLLGTVAQDPLAGVPATVDGDMIMALIQPHLGDDAFKAQLGVAMRGLGIENLNETPADKFRPLYAAFAKLIASKPPAQAASII